MRKMMSGLISVFLMLFVVGISVGNAQTRPIQYPKKDQAASPAPQNAQSQQRRQASGGRTGMVTAQVPVQVGVAPTGIMLGGPALSLSEFGFEGRLLEDRMIHTGLRLDVTAIITAELVRKHRQMVPRKALKHILDAGEVRFSPSILRLLPTTLYLSPPVMGNAQAWGATWSLVGAGLAKGFGNFRPSLGGSVIATLMYINSPSLAAQHYFFIRPGVELNLDLEFQLIEQFLVSVGWASQVYLPQTLTEAGAAMLGTGGFDRDSLWHIGQFYVQFHFRVPYPHKYRRR